MLSVYLQVSKKVQMPAYKLLKIQIDLIVTKRQSAEMIYPVLMQDIYHHCK